MGHYDCPGCGQLHCICPAVKTKDETLGKWMVNHCFDVVKSDDMPWIVRLGTLLYETKKQAEQALPILICEAMDREEARHRDEMADLRRRLIEANDILPSTRKGPKVMAPVVLSPRHEDIKIAVLRVKYSQRTCPHCKSRLIPGQAFHQELSPGRNCWNSKDPAKLVDCHKCSSCGYSETVE